MPAATRLAPALGLLLLALALFLPGQSSLPPFDRDESRYAQATAQMLDTGNWVDIRFQDQPRWRYPAGIYWLQAAAVSLTGEAGARAIWSFRLPSVLGAIAAVLLTLAAGERLLGPAAGRIAAALLAAALILGTEARMAKTDAMLLATVTLAQLALATIYLRRDAQPPPGRGWAAVFWAALGAGGLIKGPIILLVSGGTILLLAISERRWRWLGLLRPAWGVPLMLAIVLPWLIAIMVVSHGQFLDEALGRNMLAKMAEGQESHGAPPGYFLALLPVTFWPGSLLAVLAIPFAWRERRSPAVRFCLGWILPAWLVFELAATKLPHYVLPTYPAIACLAAGGLLRGSARLWRPSAYWTAAGVWIAIGLGLAALPLAATLYLDQPVDPWLVAAAAVAAVLVAAAPALLRRGRTTAAIAAMLAAAWVIYAAALGRGLPRLEPLWLSPRIAAAVARDRPCPESLLASVPFAEPSLVFLAGTRTRLVDDAADAAAHLAADPRCALALVGADEQADFLARLAARGITPRALDRIDGINYSKGRRLSLTLYGGPQAGPAPAAPSRGPVTN
jgi:4-amino-4-deoxy-L-arabinose transferase-like glycosyltransferase